MTGFGSAGLETESLRAVATARSLNHRYLDVSVQVPRRLQPIESEIRSAVARAVRRGRVEVSVSATVVDDVEEGVVSSRPLVSSLVRSMRDLQNEFGLEGGVSVSDVMRFPGALERSGAPADVPDGVRTAVLGLVSQALEALEGMRRAEGERLLGELEHALGVIERSADAIERRAAETQVSREEALRARVRELVEDLGVEETRLYQEVVRAVERHDVAEELQRLRSHVAMTRELLGGEAPAGKRLDFLAQELMREANTMGSKSADAPSVQAVVALKSEIERLREQVQNVE
jgi:uncharacterized protein (TIGR00255 family)